jgi:hypothetical protein
MTLPENIIPESIVPMILYRIRDTLETRLIDEVPDDNPTRLIYMNVGKFQENPVKKNISIAIAGGDYEDPNYLDGRVDHNELDQVGLRNLPIGEIGGGEYWWRRGNVRVSVFFVRQGFEEEAALKYAYDFYSRLQMALNSVSVSGLVDDYGEMASMSPIIEAANFHGSGGGKKNIWRGKMLFRVLTWRP